MSDADELLLGMFDATDFKVPNLKDVPGLDAAIENLEFRQTDQAGDEVVRQITQHDLVMDVLNIDLPVTDPVVKAAPAPLAVPPPAVQPTATTRRQRLQDMITSAGINVADYSSEIDALITSMEQYLDGQVKAARSKKGKVIQ